MAPNTLCTTLFFPTINEKSQRIAVVLALMSNKPLIPES
ncbi:hypothetical protein YpsIP31758_1698 [Yersinia pseudotuberculosis IP 31758]|uniref:Uncharacterized protein n=1 Tax=Yersinia pseudotuberculosis serotype O:1b (strain IP 31758) TaxID=349747 RepID=A0A0U1R0U0_YERP3|nr:hypothetical protein YpsIP31758_1698 [Yersinia pseudotuberculosis IP 31758]ABX87601.1 hypothetical protein YpAngola_A2637 [Yersinia pestis Angola]EDR55826.1 hypothetical protein YpMG051020_0134 [Yersinia pestis biovar Orientalis str. MG05-1020]